MVAGAGSAPAPQVYETRDLSSLSFPRRCFYSETYSQNCQPNYLETIDIILFLVISLEEGQKTFFLSLGSTKDPK
jgi:hypothetical protein